MTRSKVSVKNITRCWKLEILRFQNLYLTPLTTGAGKWLLILKLEHNIYIYSGQICDPSLYRPINITFCTTTRQSKCVRILNYQLLSLLAVFHKCNSRSSLFTAHKVRYDIQCINRSPAYFRDVCVPGHFRRLSLPASFSSPRGYDRATYSDSTL